LWIGRNAFVQGICANIGEGETYFLKTSRARRAHAHVHYIYAKDRLIPLRISFPSHETAVARDELAVYTQNSLENFVRISYSRQKVVRLFKKWYDFSESPTTFSHISCSHRRISCSHRRISYSRCKERPSRAREPLPSIRGE
jgi:hypothetical protein